MSKETVILVALFNELKAVKGEDHVFSWDDVPHLVVVGVRFLAEFKEFTGRQKKALLVQALVELCPDDEIDKLIPPVVDVIWGLVKMLLDSQTCSSCCACTDFCVVS
jgi:hypothetical protein